VSGSLLLPLVVVVDVELPSSGSAMCNSVREIRECVMMKSALRRSSPLAWNGLLASAALVSLTHTQAHAPIRVRPPKFPVHDSRICKLQYKVMTDFNRLYLHGNNSWSTAIFPEDGYYPCLSIFRKTSNFDTFVLQASTHQCVTD